MHPIFIRTSWFTIHTFGVMMMLASLAAILYIRWAARRETLLRPATPDDPDEATRRVEDVITLSVETLLVGLIGSRLLYVAVTWEQFAGGSLLDVLALWKGGLVWYGGPLAATPYALLRARSFGFHARRLADVIAPSVMLGLGIGRIGCLMAGDDHGKLVPDGPHWWTLTFTHPEALVAPNLMGRPLWPTQPLMTMGDLLVVGILLLVRGRLRPWPGRLTALMFSLYAVLRFFIEMIRGDVVRKFVLEDLLGHEALSTSQAISIPVLLVGVAAFFLLPRSPDEVGAQAGSQSPGTGSGIPNSEGSAPPQAKNEKPQP